MVRSVSVRSSNISSLDLVHFSLFPLLRRLAVVGSGVKEVVITGGDEQSLPPSLEEMDLAGNQVIEKKIMAQKNPES